MNLQVSHFESRCSAVAVYFLKAYIRVVPDRGVARQPLPRFGLQEQLANQQRDQRYVCSP